VNLDQKNRQVVIDFNLPKAISLPYTAVQVSSILHQPQIYDPVQKQLTSTRAQALQAGLNDLNDVSAVLTVGAETETFGRRLGPNNGVFVTLLDAAANAVSSEQAETTINSLVDDCNQLSKQIPHRNVSEPTFGDYAASRRQQLKDVCTRAAIAKGTAYARLAKFLHSIHIEQLADLLNNQPQLVLTGSWRIKSSLVGPDEKSVHFSGEWSPNSLNTLRSNLAGKRGAEALAAFKSAASDATRTPRFKLSFQYTWLERFALDLPADSLNLNLPRARRLTASFTYGQSLLFDSAGKETGRIDAAAQYDNFSDDPKHKDRGTIGVTYSQKLSKDFVLPIGIVYANHGQFLGDVQKRFSAHFGLKVKVPYGNG
jgi:hypothetical protein